MLALARRPRHVEQAPASAAELMTSTEFQRQIIEQAPINIMICDVEELKIRYANAASLQTLKRIEHLLPIRAESLIGTSIDVFHKHPAHQRAMLADPRNLPHRARIRLGAETLDLFVTALFYEGVYRGLLLTWSIATREVETASRFETEVKGAVDTMSSTVPELARTAAGLTKDAAATSEHTKAVAVACDQLAAANAVIDERVGAAGRTAEEARGTARATVQQMQSLREAAAGIGGVVDLIRNVAEKTNLLALNATIEAARAGDAGRGFAVVAQEVKTLAQQTTQATQSIVSRIEQVQGEAASMLTAIGRIEQSVDALGDATSTIAAAVTQQNVATGEVTSTIRELRDLADGTRQAADGVGDTGARIGREMAELDRAVTGFLADIRDRRD